jgi:DNA-binding NarL/FixJ family response regulator
VRLVIADNDRDALDLIALDLRLEGHEVAAAVSDGAGAVDACDRERPDVLVVDYRMPPGMDGVEVAKRVLAGATASRVIVYSNYQDPAVIRAAQRAGARWLQKGDLAALRQAVCA